MDKQRVVETLEQLHSELSVAEKVDPETLALVQTLANDVDRILQRDFKASPVDVEPVSGRLRDLVERFESEHPQLSYAVGKVADALAAIGI